MSLNRPPKFSDEQEEIIDAPSNPDVVQFQPEAARVENPSPVNAPKLARALGRMFRFEKGPNAHTPEVRAEYDPFDQD